MRIAAVLTGGQSRRMGQDKALLPLDGQPMIVHVLGRLRPQVRRVVLAGPHDHGTGLPVAPDAAGFTGPLAGIFGMADWLGRCGAGADGFLCVPVDAPRLPPDLAERLSGGEGRTKGSAVAADRHALHPTFAWWNLADLARVRPRLASAGSLHALAGITGARIERWDDGSPFLNLNTRGDVEAFLRGPQGEG